MSSTPRHLADCKPTPPGDTPAAAAALTGTGNGCATVSPPDDVREMHKYYWQQQQQLSKDVIIDQHPQPSAELRIHDDYTTSSRLPAISSSAKLMSCADPAKLLSSVAALPGEYYQTSPGYGEYMHGYGGGYGPSPTHHSTMMHGYHHNVQGPAAGYLPTCPRITSSTTSPGQFNDVKPAPVVAAGNTAELYQWVREQQNFTNAANAIGIHASSL